MSTSPLRWLFRILFPTLYALTCAHRIYCVRHKRLLREYELVLYQTIQLLSLSTWTRDDIVQLASLTVTRKLETTRRHVQAVKAALAAKKKARATNQQTKRTNETRKGNTK